MQKAFTFALAVIAALSMGMAWYCSNQVERISQDASRQISRLSAENLELKRALGSFNTSRNIVSRNQLSTRTASYARVR